MCFQSVLSLNEKHSGLTVNVFYCISAGQKGKKLQLIDLRAEQNCKYTTSTCYIAAIKEEEKKTPENEVDCDKCIVPVQQLAYGIAS